MTATLMRRTGLKTCGVDGVGIASERGFNRPEELVGTELRGECPTCGTLWAIQPRRIDHAYRQSCDGNP